MVRYTNPSGYVKYDTEAELCKELEKFYFPKLFGNKWKPIEGKTKEVWITQYERIDYSNEKYTIFIEVKNWWVTHKETIQIMGYRNVLKELKLILICGGIQDDRRSLLELHDVEILLVKDIQEINTRSVAHWM